MIKDSKFVRVYDTVVLQIITLMRSLNSERGYNNILFITILCISITACDSSKMSQSEKNQQQCSFDIAKENALNAFKFKSRDTELIKSVVETSEDSLNYFITVALQFKNHGRLKVEGDEVRMLNDGAAIYKINKQTCQIIDENYMRNYKSSSTVDDRAKPFENKAMYRIIPNWRAFIMRASL